MKKTWWAAQAPAQEKRILPSGWRTEKAGNIGDVTMTTEAHSHSSHMDYTIQKRQKRQLELSLLPLEFWCFVQQPVLIGITVPAWIPSRTSWSQGEKGARNFHSGEEKKFALRQRRLRLLNSKCST